jgi:macrodomain Ter protein organizer (MatP/YcbG family)
LRNKQSSNALTISETIVLLIKNKQKKTKLAKTVCLSKEICCF